MEQWTVVDFCEFLVQHQFRGQRSDNARFQEIVLSQYDAFPLLAGYSGCLVHAIYISLKRQQYDNAFLQYLLHLGKDQTDDVLKLFQYCFQSSAAAALVQLTYPAELSPVLDNLILTLQSFQAAEEQ